MNQTYLDHVKEAKESLRIWLSNVEQLHNGIKMFSKENDLDRRNTAFAKWYYGEGQTFTSFEAFKALEPFYDEMYDLFLAYTELNNTPIKKSLFSSNADKQKNKLSSIFLDLRKVGRKLIKSVEIFEEKLENSPLFGGSFELENKVNTTIPNPVSVTHDIDETIIDFSKEEPQIDAIQEITQDVQVPVEEVETKQESNPDEANFEKRLQEEVAKIKEKLEAEFNTSSTKALEKGSQVDDVIENEPNTNVDTATSKTPEKSVETNSESAKKDDEIDLDEEIRRILS